MKPNSSKIAHFPIKKYYNLHFQTTQQNQFFPRVPHTYFSTKFRTTLNFIEVFTEDKPGIYATLVQNSTNHIATLSDTLDILKLPFQIKNLIIITFMILTL